MRLSFTKFATAERLSASRDDYCHVFLLSACGDRAARARFDPPEYRNQHRLFGAGFARANWINSWTSSSAQLRSPMPLKDLQSWHPATRKHDRGQPVTVINNQALIDFTARNSQITALPIRTRQIPAAPCTIFAGAVIITGNGTRVFAKRFISVSPAGGSRLLSAGHTRHMVEK